MALQSTSQPGFVKTGPSAESGLAAWFSDISNKATFLPFFGGGISFITGAIGTAIETISQLFKGDILSAGTALAAGTASTAVNSAVGTAGMGSVFWWANAGQALITHRSAGSLARAGTETIIGSVFGAVGMKPKVLRPDGPGKFTTQIANERGQDANALYNQKMAGEAGAYVSPSLTGQQSVA